MTLALMSNTARGFFFLVAIVLLLFAAFAAWVGHKSWPVLVAIGWAVFMVPFCYDAFAA